MQGGAIVQTMPSVAAAAPQPFTSAAAVELGAASPQPRAVGTSTRVRAARKSEPAVPTSVAAQQQLAAAANPSILASIRSSLGQRGGVVKKSDGFDIFFGLVGDQPGSDAGNGANGSPTQAAQQGAAAKTSMRPVLGKRGGVVRKSDAFEVFYGLVGDQPSDQPTVAGQGNQAKEAPTSVPDASGQDAEKRSEEQEGAEKQEEPAAAEVGGQPEAEQEGGVRISTMKVAPNLAMFSLATPATSFAPGPGGPQAANMLAANRLAGELNKRLGAQGPKAPIPEFSLATPAASFSPTKRPVVEKDWLEEDYCEDDVADLPARLNAVGDVPTKEDFSDFAARLNAVANARAEIYSLATPATSLAPCQAIPELDISNVAARIPAQSQQNGSGQGAGLWSISSASFPDFFGAGRRFGGGSLQQRLEGLDGAIAKLRALQTS